MPPHPKSCPTVHHPTNHNTVFLRTCSLPDHVSRAQDDAGKGVGASRWGCNGIFARHISMRSRRACGSCCPPLCQPLPALHTSPQEDKDRIAQVRGAGDLQSKANAHAPNAHALHMPAKRRVTAFPPPPLLAPAGALRTCAVDHAHTKRDEHGGLASCTLSSLASCRAPTWRCAQRCANVASRTPPVLASLRCPPVAGQGV